MLKANGQRGVPQGRLIFDEAEALAAMPHRKVVRPTAEYRVDQLHDPIHWLRLVAAEHILELPLQRRSLLELRRVIDTPYPSTTANATIAAFWKQADLPF